MAETPNEPSPEGPGLPPVVPPSGRYIAQLFIVPGLIVAGAVSVLLFFSWIASGSHTPEGFLAGLRDVNPEVRWRSASDLAQVLLRDETLATNPQFGIELASRLQESLPALKKEMPPATPETAAERRRYILQRSEVQYLTACLGHLGVPVGAKVLSDMVSQPTSPDAKSDALLRRQAVWALAELGHNSQRVAKFPKEKLDKINAELDRLSAGSGEQGEWAKAAIAILKGESSGGVIAALAKCVTTEDPFLRKEVALALSFWKGSAEENAVADESLVRLTRDSGQGPRIEITDKD